MTRQRHRDRCRSGRVAATSIVGLLLAGCTGSQGDGGREEPSAREDGAAEQVAAAYESYADVVVPWTDFSVSAEPVELSDAQLDEQMSASYDYIVPLKLEYYSDMDGLIAPEFTTMIPGFTLKAERREDMQDLTVYRVKVRIGGDERQHLAARYYSATREETILWDPVLIGIGNHLGASSDPAADGRPYRRDRGPDSSRTDERTASTATTCEDYAHTEKDESFVNVQCKDPEKLIRYDMIVSFERKLDCESENGKCTRVGMKYTGTATCKPHPPQPGKPPVTCLNPLISDGSSVAGPSTGTQLTQCTGSGQNRPIGIHGVGSGNAVCVNSTSSTTYTKVSADVKGSCGGAEDKAAHGTAEAHYEHEDKTSTESGAALASAVHIDSTFEKTCGQCES